MPIELWIGFVVASCVLVAIPGPTILTVISYSIVFGNRATVPLIVAVALGDSTALFLSLAGLGAVLATSAWLFTAVKWLGGLYLIYLGVKLIRQGTNRLSVDGLRNTDSRWKLFFNTLLVTALNPKGIIFFIAFLPQFVDPSAPSVDQLWILSLTFVVIATVNASLYAVFASHARQLVNSPDSLRRINVGGGGLLTIAGGWALTAKQVV